MPNDVKLSTVNTLLPRKLTCVFVPVAAATSSVPPVWSWKRPVLAGLTAVDAVSEPEMLSVPLLSTVGALLAPVRVQVAPASTASVWKLMNEVPIPLIEPVLLPPASSSVFVPPLFALALPTKTAPGSTTRRLVALAVKSTA